MFTQWSFLFSLDTSFFLPPLRISASSRSLSYPFRYLPHLAYFYINFSKFLKISWPSGPPIRTIISHVSCSGLQPGSTTFSCPIFGKQSHWHCSTLLLGTIRQGYYSQPPPVVLVIYCAFEMLNKLNELVSELSISLERGREWKG